MALIAQGRMLTSILVYIGEANLVLAFQVERSIGGEKLWGAAWVKFEAETGRF